MSDYPSAVLSTHARNYSVHKQEALSDYGCLEAVDIEVASLSNTLVFAKRHSFGLGEDSSPFLDSLPKSIDSRVLEPSHDFLMLDKPEPIRELLDDDRSFADCYPTSSLYSLVSHQTAVIQATPFPAHLNNLAEDHPDITHDTFFHLIADVSHNADALYCGSDDWSVPVSPFERALGDYRNEMYVRHFDPSLCDVNKQVLRDIYLGELQYDGLTFHCDRDFTGGALSYTCLGTKNQKQYGVLICPQTQTLDELSFKLISIDSYTELEKEDNSYFDQQKQSPIIPSIKIGSDFRQTLNGRILQIDVVPENETNVLFVGVRSDYCICMNKFRGDQTEWNDEFNRLVYTSDSAVSTLSVIKTHSRTTSIANSPYIPGECVISTEDRCVRLWNADIDNTMENQLDLEVLMTGTMGGLRSSNPWRQVCFAAHPRQINVADSESVCVFDTRTQDEYLALLNIMTSKHRKEGEKIYCIESGRNFGNDHECLIATDSNLYLIDQRHCGEPLLQMGTCMMFPPQYIRPCVVNSTEVKESEFSPSRWCNTTTAVLLANQSAQELFSYQLCKTKQISVSNSGDKIVKVYSPQSVAPPRKLGSYSDVWRNLKVNPSKHSPYLKTRTSKKLVGIEAIDLKTKNGAVLAMQINSVGDIGYQTLSMIKSEDAYDLRQTLTGKTEETILTNDEEMTRRNLGTIKIQNYSKWAEAVCSRVKDDKRVKVMSKDVGLAFGHVAQHRKCTLSRRFNSTVFSLERMQEFTSSNCRICAANIQLLHGKTDESCTTNCCSCQTNMSKSNTMVETLMGNSNDICSSLNNSLLNRDCDVLENDDENQCETGKLALGRLFGDNRLSKGDEVGELLKGTWSDSYENYWEKQRKEQNEMDLENQRKDSILTHDLANNDNEDFTNSILTDSLIVIPDSSLSSQIPSILKKSKKPQELIVSKKTPECKKKIELKSTEGRDDNSTANLFSPRKSKGTPKRVQFSSFSSPMKKMKRDSPRNIFPLPKPVFSVETESLSNHFESESISRMSLDSTQPIYNFFSPSRGIQRSPSSPNNSKKMVRKDNVDSFIKSKFTKKKYMSNSLGF